MLIKKVFNAYGIGMESKEKDYLRPFEAEVFRLLEKRRERLNIAPVDLFMQAINKSDHAAKKHYDRLQKTHSGDKLGKYDKSTITLEDACRLARHLHIDLSDIIKQAEENLGYSRLSFPTIQGKPGKKTA